MSPEIAVRECLLVLPSVTAIVAARIYMLKLPQGATLPAVRVQIIDELDEGHLRGAGGLSQSRVQVDGYVEETAPDPYGTLEALANAIAGDGAGNGLRGWRGTIAGVQITGIFRLDRDATYEAAELRLLRTRQDFRVWWRPLTSN